MLIGNNVLSFNHTWHQKKAKSVFFFTSVFRKENKNLNTGQSELKELNEHVERFYSTGVTQYMYNNLQVLNDISLAVYNPPHQF